MSKLIRFDEDHFGYLIDADISDVDVQRISHGFAFAYPGKRLLVLMADEFVDLTGQYELVPIPDGVPA